MKLILATVLAFFTASAFANAPAISYHCECIDTGYECDGVDYLKLKLTGNRATFELQDRDGDATTDADIEANFNEKLTERDVDSRYNFGYETTNTNGVYPKFFINKSMLNRAAQGTARLAEYSHGTLSHIWQYRCQLVR